MIKRKNGAMSCKSKNILLRFVNMVLLAMLCVRHLSLSRGMILETGQKLAEVMGSMDIGGGLSPMMGSAPGVNFMKPSGFKVKIMLYSEMQNAIFQGDANL